jgi:hypothetical protein
MNSRSHNSAYSRLMVLSELGQNSVKSSGGSLRLANGQVGIFRLGSNTADGSAAVASLDGYSRKELFQIQVGTGRTQDAGNMTNKNFATIPFRREDILDVTYDTAKAPVYSSVTLGYNGVAGTGIKLKENEGTSVSLKLFGEQLSYLGFRDGVAEMTFNVFSGSPDACDNCLNPCANTSCKSIVTDLVDTIREYELRAGSDMGTGASIKVGDLVEVIGTYSCTPDLVPSDTVTYYTIERCDEGTSEALAQVQAWVNQDANLGGASPANNVDVERISREGSNSTYQIVSDTAPSAAFAEPANLRNGAEVTKVILDCEDCPAGSTEIAGGFVYNLVTELGTITPAQIKAAVETIAAVTTATAVDTGLRGPEINTEKFLVVTDAFATVEAMVAALDADINIDAEEFEVEFVSESETVCLATYSADTIAWVTGKSCDLFSRTIQIDVDLDCGPFATPAAKTTASNEKLAELQAIYPSLSVALDSANIGDCRARFTGTQESAPVCDDCDVPEAIYPALPADYEFASWELRTAAEGEITSYTIAAGTLSVDAADGGSGNAQTLTQGTSAAFVSTSGSGTGAVVKVELDAASNTVTSVALADGGEGFAVGDTISLNIALAPFSLSSTGTITLTITGVGGEFPDDCECGIKFVAKNAYLCPPAMLADQIGTFTPKGVKIQVSGGEAPSVLMEGYQFVTTPFKVTRHERDFDGTGWGVNYMKQEKASQEYFAGISPRRSYAEGYLSGFETKLEPCVQYDKFTVKLKRNPYAGTASRRMGEEIRYVFLIPQGAGCSYGDFIEALGGSIDCTGSPA